MKRDSRVFYLFIVMLTLCTLLIGRLFYIQVIAGPYYSSKANIQKVEEEKSKIEVLDRNGEPLTGSYYEKYAVISPRWLSEQDKQSLIKNNLLISADVTQPQHIKVTRQNINLINKLKGTTPGVFIYNKKIDYGPRALATHVVGYNGQTGIEKTLNNITNTEVKSNLIVKDGLNQPIPGLSKNNQKTRGVQLTIDSRIQRIVEDIIDKQISSGAVVVLDAKTNEILAMASRPNYKQYKIENYLNQKGAPLINRAVEGYTPGSIFKILILSAALEENITDLNEVFLCSGYVKLGKNIYRCSSYEDGGHGKITLKEAMAYSCNSVFIELGLRLGSEKITEYAKKFGLGNKMYIGLPEEKGGFIPEPQNIYYADMGNLSIGQGQVECTPLQAATMLSIIANDGILVQPSLIKRYVNIDDIKVDSTLQRQEPERVISKNTARKVKTALEAVIEYGTGTMAYTPPEIGKSAGKTGTAEVTKNVNHAWFVGYHPADNPKYIISVFNEKGGAGPVKAAPIFKNIIEKINCLN